MKRYKLILLIVFCLLLLASQRKYNIAAPDEVFVFSVNDRQVENIHRTTSELNIHRTEENQKVVEITSNNKENEIDSTAVTEITEDQAILSTKEKQVVTSININVTADEIEPIEQDNELEITLDNDKTYKINEEELDILHKIVEAEATGGDEKSKILIANVVLNRLKSDDFPDTIKDVVFQVVNGVYQFSPILDKRYYKVGVTESTIQAVDKAIDGSDYSQGALFFMARKQSSKKSVTWFDRNLDFLFKYECHEFFK